MKRMTTNSVNLVPNGYDYRRGIPNGTISQLSRLFGVKLTRSPKWCWKFRIKSCRLLMRRYNDGITLTHFIKRLEWDHAAVWFHRQVFIKSTIQCPISVFISLLPSSCDELVFALGERDFSEKDHERRKAWKRWWKTCARLYAFRPCRSKNGLMDQSRYEWEHWELT